MKIINVNGDSSLKPLTEKIQEGELLWLLVDYREMYQRYHKHHLWCTFAAEIHDLYRMWLMIERLNDMRDPDNRFHINLIWDKTLSHGEWWLKVGDRIKYTNRAKSKYHEGFYKPKRNR